MPGHVGEAREHIKRALEEAAVAESGVMAEWLLAHVLHVSRTEIGLCRDHPLTRNQRDRLAVSVERLLRHEPVQYVWGETQFMDITLRVDGRALIPRPETEELVACVLEDTEIWKREHPAIADVGTGSGCIVLALIQARPQGRYTAVDISEKALTLARENAASYGVESRIDWREADLLEGMADASLDIVISNPPYIATTDFDVLPRNVREYEPRLALDGGDRGLDVVRRLIPQAYRVLRNSGRLYLEIGADQGDGIEEALRVCGFVDVALISDLRGRGRIVRGTKR